MAVSSPRPAIAVVGVSALFPGSIDATGFWSDILDGTDRMSPVPATHWLIDDHYDADMLVPDKTYGRRGGFLDDVELDVMGFGIPPTTVPTTDTSQLLALIVAQQVLDDATTGQFSELDRSRTSVILGVTSGQELLGAMASRMNRPLWLQGMRRAGVPEDVALAACDRIADLHPEWKESTFPGLLGNVVAGRIANRLDLGGTNCVTDAACASSFSAMSMGINELYLGDSDLVIAGGVDTMNDIFMYMCFSKTPALSQSEEIRPFSDKADGTMLGEGIGMVALKRLEDAERDGNHIYCVVNGVGASSDGRSKSVYAPVSAGQARALSNAYDKTSYGPETVELVEAHGTGTVAGDAAEFGGLEIAFNASGREDRQWCALGSVKSQIGHTKAAAGAAGLFKVVMGLHHKVLPQTAKIDAPNPKLDLEASPFHLNTRSRPWVRGSDHERRGSVSSFGFGGSNFHIAMSEYTGPGVAAARLRTNDVELVVLCGTDGADVAAQARGQVDLASADGYLPWLAQTSQQAYDANAGARLAVLAADEEQLRERLAAAADRIGSAPADAFTTPTGTAYGVGETDGTVAFLFPGQGAQYLHMGADLAMSYDEALAPWDLAADHAWVDGDDGVVGLHEVVFPITSFADDADEVQSARLTATEWAQPAIGATSLGVLRMLTAMGVEASHVGGHSFGEITALHAAGALTETDMLAVARRRGELMAEAAQSPGSMTAVAATIDEVRAILDRLGADVVVANHNSQTQVVLSGPTPAIEQLEEVLRADKVTHKRLPVATAFHSSVVSGASTAFTEYLATVDVAAPDRPVIANQTAAAYPASPDEVRAQLGRQLANPVRFVEMVEAMYDGGARTFVEVGPSTILTGLVGKILAGRDHRAVALDKRARPGLGGFLTGIGQLVAAGVPLDLAPLFAGYGVMQNPHERAVPKLTIAINGANHGAPYPPADLGELVGPNPDSTVAPAAIAPAAPATAQPATAPVPPAAQAPALTPAPTAPTAPAAPSPAAPTIERTPAPMTSSPVPAVQPAALTGVLAAYEAVQGQTADAHAAYLQSMAQAHSAFLQSAHQSIEVLGHLAGGSASGPLPAGALAPASPDPMTQAPAGPAPATQTPAPPVTPIPATPAPATPVAATPVAPTPVASSPAPAAPAPVAPVAAEGVDLMGLLLSVVSEKTGYPSEMLAMEMELEGDLGIDSIKRVEILSAMQEQVPSLPEVDTSVMAELVTLGQIVTYMDGQLASAGGAVAAPATATPAAAAEDAPAMGRYGLRSVLSTPPGRPATALVDGKIALVDDGAGIAPALQARLAEGGVTAEVVRAADASHTGVIFLPGLADFADVDAAAAVNHAAFVAARELAVSGNGGLTGPFVTVSDLGGAFGTDGAATNRGWSAGLTGLVRTAAIEWPGTTVRAIDLERGDRSVDDIATALADELLGGGDDREVALAADGSRTTLQSEEVEVAPGQLPLGADDVVIVSGGARGVTAATVIELAKASGASFVLLGRTALVAEADGLADATDDASLKRALLARASAGGAKVTPAELSREAARVLANREILATLDAVVTAGGSARYVAVDITDHAAVSATLDTVRAEVGPITGVIHGAGVLADKLIAEKTDEQFARVFATKVDGLRALLDATADDALKVLCLFSSVAARTGNQGQVDYAMANEILNKVAVAEKLRRGDSCVVKSLGWGPWAGGMVSPALEAHFASMGVRLIPLDVGARMLVDELASPQTDEVELVLGGAVLPDADVVNA